MSYPMRWVGSSNPDDASGTARFIVEGEEFTFGLPNFAAAQGIADMVQLAFRQGKSFAFRAIKSHIEGALARADEAHALSTVGVPVEGKWRNCNCADQRDCTGACFPKASPAGVEGLKR
jgi:hypothetical protein